MLRPSTLTVRSGRRLWALVAASAVLATGMGVLGGQAAQAAGTGVADAAEAPTESAAAVVARRFNHPVAVEALRDEFNETVANPDGTFTLTASAEPKRVRRGAGFVPLDTSLQVNADGSLSPKAALSELRLSGGGTGPLLSLSREGKGVSLTAPWTLPKPTVQGSVATYAEVLNGIDLQITATAGGYQQILVVKNAVAARNPQLARIAWGVTGQGASMRETDGTVTVVDGQGRPVFASDTPAMWDTSNAKASLKNRALRGDDAALVSTMDGEPHRTRTMPVSVSGGHMAIEPDLGMLAAADTNFPVYIDPTLSPATPSGWTMVNSGAPNTAEYNYNSRDYYRVGVEYNTSNKWRTHLGFGITSLAHSTIYSAGLNVTAYHTNLCAGSDVDLWLAQPISNYTTYTWTNDSDDDLISKLNAQHFSANKGSCPKADDPGTFTGSLQTNLQNYATAATAKITFALRGTSESSDEDWTKFVPGSTSLSVTYDHTPGVPTSLGISKTTTCPDAAYPAGSAIGSAAPTLCAVPQDQNGGTARVEFEVWNPTHTTRAAYSNGAVTNRTVGTSAPWTVTPALTDGTYEWRVQSCDAHTCGSWSSWYAFTVDLIAPAVPSAAAVAGGAVTYSTSSWLGGSGVTGNFRFTSSSDASSIEVELNGASLNWSTPTAGVLDKIITPVEGPNTLRSRSKDTAGNTSGWSTGYTFLVANAINKSWRWEFNNALSSIDTVGSTVTNPGARAVSGFTPTYVASPGSQAVTFSGAQNLATTVPLVDTKAAFTVTARVKLGTTTPTGPMTIASQNGPTGSGFRLQYRTDVSVDGSAAAWCFVMFSADGATDTAATRACAPATQTTSDWTNLAGVYDQGTSTLQLWINDEDGVMVMWEPPTTGFTNDWQANGAVVIGRALQGGVAAQYFTGSIDRVGLFTKALTSTEVNSDKGTV